MRIGLVGLLHEPNTFIERPTTRDDFVDTCLDRRQASFRFSDNCFSRSVDGLCTPEMTYRHH